METHRRAPPGAEAISHGQGKGSTPNGGLNGHLVDFYRTMLYAACRALFATFSVHGGAVAFADCNTTTLLPTRVALFGSTPRTAQSGRTVVLILLNGSIQFDASAISWNRHAVTVGRHAPQAWSTCYVKYNQCLQWPLHGPDCSQG